jgi:hypothetical protein
VPVVAPVVANVHPSPVQVLVIPPVAETVAVNVTEGVVFVTVAVNAAPLVPVGAQPVPAKVTPSPPDVVRENVVPPSTKNTWHSFAAAAASDFAAATLALLAWLRNPGRATEARIPTIITTTRSSIKVKPLVMADPERLDCAMAC